MCNSQELQFRIVYRQRKYYEDDLGERLSYYYVITTFVPCRQAI